jgi:hypothetical protein
LLPLARWRRLVLGGVVVGEQGSTGRETFMSSDGKRKGKSLGLRLTSDEGAPARKRKVARC